MTRALLLLLILLIPASGQLVNANLTIDNIRYNVGTNRYDLFIRTLHHTDPNLVYLWEDSTDLSNWCPSLPAFVGSGCDMPFYSPVDHGSSNRFWRVVVVGPIVPGTNALSYVDTNTVEVTNYPSPVIP